MATAAYRVATYDDLDAVVETLTLAFRTDPVWGAYSFPDADRQLEQSRRFWRALATIELRFGWTMVTPDCEAVAVWIPPGLPEMTEDEGAAFEALTVELLGDDQSAVVMDAFAALDAQHPHDPPHYYLSLLATHDDHRGKGIGQALLAAGLERIDAEGMPAYLESTNPGNNHRYERAGFQPHGRIPLPNGHVITTMWRPGERMK
jgi:GNAT superfamily N-acetyltransferase